MNTAKAKKIMNVFLGEGANVATPETLSEAIHNGRREYAVQSYDGEKGIEECIERHVRDFLAQQFGAALLTAALIANSEDSETLISNLAKSIGLKVKD